MVSAAQRVAGRLVRIAGLLFAALALSACGIYGQAGTGTAFPPLVERGSVLYQQYCQSCHGGATGGNLKDIPPPHNANGHTWHHADQQIIDIIHNGFSFSLPEEQKMPAFKEKLAEDDAKAILAYIKTWWTEEQRRWQAEVTANWSRRP